METQLPEGQKLESDNNSVATFAKMVDQSKARIHAQSPADAAVPVKRGPGRPRKHPKMVSSPAPETSSVNSQASVPGSAPAPDISEYLTPPIQMLSKIPARKTGIPELAFTADEAKLCADSMNLILKTFIPDVSVMSPKTAAIISGSMTIGSLFYSKYAIYLEKTAEMQRTVSAPPPPSTPSAGGDPFPVTHVEAGGNVGRGMHAADHFRRAHA